MKDNPEQPFMESAPRRRSSGGAFAVVVIVFVVGFFGLVLVGGALILLTQKATYKEQFTRNLFEQDMALRVEVQQARAVQATLSEAVVERVTRAVTISFDGNDRLRYDGSLIATTEIADRLRGEINAQQNVDVTIIVPGETKHHRVVQLLDICRSVTERVEVRVVPENPYSTYRLTIDADSVIKHDDQVIAREDLGAELAKIENSQQTTIILQVDATLATETNVSIFEECRNIGCQVQVSSFGSGN